MCVKLVIYQEWRFLL